MWTPQYALQQLKIKYNQEDMHGFYLQKMDRKHQFDLQYNVNHTSADGSNIHNNNDDI
jgi:hypothetical protein